MSARHYQKALREIAKADWIIGGHEQACRICGQVARTEDHRPDCPTRIAREALAIPPASETPPEGHPEVA